MTLGLANVAGIVIGAIIGLIIGMLVVAAINEWLGSTVIEDLLPPGFDEVTRATFYRRPIPIRVRARARATETDSRD